jgi:hypothetical protein
MTKTSKLLKANAALAGFTFEANRAEAIATLVRAIHDEKADIKQVRLDFIAGVVAFRLFPTLKLTEAIAKGKGIAGATSQGHEPKPGQAIRTAAEETAFDTAKRQWSRLGRDAGVIKPRAPKAKTGKAKTGKAKPAAKPAIALKPKTAAMANTQLLNMAQMASGYCAKHKTLVCDEASHAVADFLAAMARIAK